MSERRRGRESLIDRVYSCLKPVLLVLTIPRRFFQAYFNQPERLEAMEFPLSGAWRHVISTPQTIMPPLRCLGTALGVLGFVLLFKGLVMEIVLPDELMLEMKGSERSAELFFEQYTGLNLVKIDTQHLTGLTPIDEPVGEYFQLFRYLYFAALFALFLGRRSPHRKVIDYFAYVLSACVIFVSVATMLAIVVFVVLAFAPDAAFAFSGLVEVLGELPKLFYCLVLPIAIFPSLFGFARRHVVRAIVLAVAAWIGNQSVFHTVPADATRDYDYMVKQVRRQIQE